MAQSSGDMDRIAVPDSMLPNWYLTVQLLWHVQLSFALPAQRPHCCASLFQYVGVDMWNPFYFVHCNECEVLCYSSSGGYR
ncbi:hypothetical protein PsorP6_004633 [Peronosclerospora sorghi]|uniref:Uncharacterized protein n=1 Tax=Peronosclerospora sorghi TaxID=230839 RepID=A0ACC0VN84_9STRA|nr:hypothetical protein PsorP6_004633 [Peronosclerospora sorghi]